MEKESSMGASLISLKRKPYHYQATNNWEEGQSGSVQSSSAVICNSSDGSSNNSDINGDAEPLDTPTPVDNTYVWSNRANYSRYLYYNQLRRHVIPESDDILLIPPHVIPNQFFYPQYAHSTDGKQNSVITIFAIWNTMMGTSLLNMPWAMERAGFIPGILLLSAMAFISFYTAYRILEVFEAHENSVITDFAVLCKRLLGRWAQVIAVIFSALTILGAMIVYWVLMSNFLYHTVEYFHTAIYHDAAAHEHAPALAQQLQFQPMTWAFAKNESGDSIYCPSRDSANSTDDDPDDPNDLFHKIWSLHRTVPLFLMIILGPLACVRSPTFFMKFNTLGTLSVVYLLVFVFVKWADFGVNINFVDPTSPSYVALFKSSCPALSGVLSLAFFIHNCIVTIMKNNRNQRKNRRDLALAYVFVVLTYFLIGGIFYIIFPLDKICIEDNFLNNFRSRDLWTFIARIFLFFQMVSVFPLLMYILRVQICYSLTKQEPTASAVYTISVVVMSICIMFAIFLPQIGTIIRFTGAICGLVYVFVLPISLYLKWQSNIRRLSNASLVFHLGLMGVGLVNFVLQFLVHV